MGEATNLLKSDQIEPYVGFRKTLEYRGKTFQSREKKPAWECQHSHQCSKDAFNSQIQLRVFSQEMALQLQTS